MHPKFFSEFPTYSSAPYRFMDILAKNIGCHDPFFIDRNLVDFLYRINRSETIRPPFDPVKVATRLHMEVSYDDFPKTFGYLNPPKHNSSDSFKITVNKRLEKTERDFTVAHETSERLIGFDENGGLQMVNCSSIFERETKEKTCDKIAREITMPSPVIEHDASRINHVSLNSFQKLANFYEVPLSQMIKKVTDDLSLLEVALMVKEDNKVYGSKKILIENENIPICQLECRECKDRIDEIERKTISRVLGSIKSGEKIEGVIIEGWKEKPLPEDERSYWIAYKPRGRQKTLI